MQNQFIKALGMVGLAISLSGSVLFTTLAQDTLEARLATMTLEQKVGQLFMVTFYGFPMNQPARDLVTTWQPGAIALLPDNLGTPEDITHLTNSIQQILQNGSGIPALIAVDQEGGIIAHLDEGFTEFPVPSLWAATDDADLLYRVGQAMAGEMLAVGINMDLAPVADLDTNPLNPIIGRRSFGTYPKLVANAISAWITGAQSAGIVATAKHFPGHGDTAQDSHTTLPVIQYGLERLESVELVPFEATIEAGVGAVMVAHIAFPTLNGDATLPASLSSVIVTDLLRDTLQYDGIIMTDAMDMDAIDTVYSPEERALKAIEAGHDLILLGANISPESQIKAMQAVVNAVNRGDISIERINQSVSRILRAKEAIGLLEWEPLDSTTAQDRILAVNAQPLVRELFEKGITVVQDNAQLLPMDAGTLFVFPATRPSLWTACQRDGITPLGVSVSPTDDEISVAQQSATIASKVVVFVEEAYNNPQQQKMVQALPIEKTIVIALQSPRDWSVLPPVSTFLTTYSPMPLGFEPLCAILLGDALAKGTISVSLDR